MPMVSIVKKLVAVRDKIPKDASDILGLIKAAIDSGGGGGGIPYGVDGDACWKFWI